LVARCALFKGVSQTTSRPVAEADIAFLYKGHFWLSYIRDED